VGAGRPFRPPRAVAPSIAAARVIEAAPDPPDVSSASATAGENFSGSGGSSTDPAGDDAAVIEASIIDDGVADDGVPDEPGVQPNNVGV